jgi:cytochrome b561/polyisoprenoid-binding protein YceI
MGPRLPRYSAVAIVLHWTIAAAIVVQVLLAWRMHGPSTPERFAVFQLHKSVGVTILALSLARLAWRLTHRPPRLPDTLARWERILARMTHTFFYVVMIGMPLSGWIMVSASPVGVPTLLYGQLPWPHIPMLAELAPAAKARWSEAGETIHGLLAIGFLTLLPLHIAGALKHQLFSRDEPVLFRMAPGAIPGRCWLEPRLLAIFAGLAAAAAIGIFLRPPPPGVSPPRAPAATAAWTPGAQPDLPEPFTWTVQAPAPIRFTTSWSGQAVTGAFTRWKADIRFSPQALERSRVRVSINLSSATTGEPMRDAALTGQDWLDATAHPTAEFIAEQFEQAGPNRYIAHGALTLRGTTRPQDLAFDLSFADPLVRMTAQATVDRTAFGVGRREYRATDQVPAAVNLDIAFVARRTP